MTSKLLSSLAMMVIMLMFVMLNAWQGMDAQADTYTGEATATGFVDGEDMSPVVAGGFAVPEPDSSTGGPATSDIHSGALPDITTHGIVIYGTGYVDGQGGWHQFLPGGPVTPISTDKAYGKQGGNCLFHLEYMVINKGNAVADGFNNRMALNGQTLGHHSNLSLAPGENEVLMFKNVALTPGQHTFELWLDDGNKVAESNENNNYRIARVDLQGSCIDDFKTPVAPETRTPDERRPRSTPPRTEPGDTRIQKQETDWNFIHR